ncbi:MucR family transcriptional regulator [Microvirga pudoricolor]|uniref:MucR family transcriptional regulator n=1 Tax=Microvirga pudoricolor TaxID=2778729 RepID=UPI00195201BA|nr:MucR family transcriptional regulator [Microvirga pudoricolor]MBM6595177.1 MucR family transcriptional regulator [Microvirga pudoricolor]
MDQTDQTKVDYTELTAHVVSSYVAHNAVHRADLPTMIASVYGALQGLGAPKAAEPVKQPPAVPVKKSVTPDFLISLEDGKHYKSLKRHLTKLGITPAEYREKWGLPRDYPMVAASYAQRRSELAKSIGLGSMRKQAAEPEVEAAPVEAPKAKRRSPAKRKAAR